MLGLENDWVGMWMGHVLLQVWLQGRDPFKVMRVEVDVTEDLPEVSCPAEF